jgi:hypothetical protein
MNKFDKVVNSVLTEGAKFARGAKSAKPSKKKPLVNKNLNEFSLDQKTVQDIKDKFDKMEKYNRERQADDWTIAEWLDIDDDSDEKIFDKYRDDADAEYEKARKDYLNVLKSTSRKNKAFGKVHKYLKNTSAPFFPSEISVVRVTKFRNPEASVKSIVYNTDLESVEISTEYIPDNLSMEEVLGILGSFG